MKIEGYLTQKKLKIALQGYGGCEWIGGELTVPGSRRRWDMAIKLNKEVIVVEYDGDEHYRNALKIKIDNEKDEVAFELGYKVVRIPYWIQLDSKMFEYYFGVEARIEQDFPHGFITTKLFPASFCELGIERFKLELDAIPDTVRTSVLASLQDRTAEFGKKYVVPKALANLL